MYEWSKVLSRNARGRQRLLSVAVAVFTLPMVSVGSVSAQDSPAAAYTGSMGSVTVADEQWYGWRSDRIYRSAIGA